MIAWSTYTVQEYKLNVKTFFFVLSLYLVLFLKNNIFDSSAWIFTLCSIFIFRMMGELYELLLLSTLKLISSSILEVFFYIVYIWMHDSPINYIKDWLMLSKISNSILISREWHFIFLMLIFFHSFIFLSTNLLITQSASMLFFIFIFFVCFSFEDYSIEYRTLNYKIHGEENGKKNE